MPYKVPDNALVTGLVCKRVFIPDSLEYRAVMLGMLDYTSKWVAWKDDSGERRESAVAGIWKKALEQTLLAWEEGCGEMDYDGIRDIIAEELEKMTINNCITVNCGCGNGCGCGGAQTIPEDVPPVGQDGEYNPETDIIEEIAEPFPDEEAVNYICARSQELVDTFADVVLQVEDVMNKTDDAYEDVDELLAGALALQNTEGVEPTTGYFILLWAAFYYLASVAVRAFTSKSAADMKNTVLQYRSQLVCALVNADGSNAKRQAFIDGLNALPLPWVCRYYMTRLEQSVDYEQWFYAGNPTSVTTPCPCGVTAQPPLPQMTDSTDWLMVLVNTGDIEDINLTNTTVDHLDYGIIRADNDDSFHFSAGTARVIGEDVRTSIGGDTSNLTLMGYVVEILDGHNLEAPYTFELDELTSFPTSKFRSFDVLRSDIETMEGYDDFIGQFDVVTWGAGYFPTDNVDLDYDMLNNANEAYDSWVEFRVLYLYKVSS